jgi:hypothetical protein
MTVAVALFYAVVSLATLALAIWILRSPVLRQMLRGQGVDPGQWGTWQDHLEDIGVGPSWRSDGTGGQRETRVYSKYTRRS